MIAKVHKSPDGKKIIALCDEDILNKKFEEGNRQLDLTSNFYAGENMTEEEILKQMEGRSYHINAVGEKSIEFCIQQKFIDTDSVKKIAGVPYAQAAILKE